MWSRQGQRSKPAQMPRPGWKSIPGERSEVKDQGQGGKAKSGSWLSNRSMPAGLGEVRVKAWLSRLFWGQSRPRSGSLQGRQWLKPVWPPTVTFGLFDLCI